MGIQDFMIVYNEGRDTLYISAMEYVGTTPNMGAYEYGQTTAITDDGWMTSNQYESLWNYPNPFNSQTTIKYQLAKKEKLTLIIYDITGKKVAVLENSLKEIGKHSVVFKANHLDDSIYFCKLQTASGYTNIRKIVLLK